MAFDRNSQLWFPNRTVSQNDIIAEAIGSALGAGCWIAVGQTAVEWLRSFARDLRPKKQVDWLLQLYLLGFLIHALLPFDLTISVAARFRIWPVGRQRRERLSQLPFQGSEIDTTRESRVRPDELRAPG